MIEGIKSYNDIGPHSMVQQNKKLYDKSLDSLVPSYLAITERLGTRLVPRLPL